LFRQYVVIYTVHIVETSVPKIILHFHLRVMKPSTTVSYCIKAKVSECVMTSDHEFAVCVP
jgi:hypothetical protein